MKAIVLFAVVLFCSIGQGNAQQLQTNRGDKSGAKGGTSTARPMTSSKLTASQQLILRNDVLAADLQKSLELEQAANSSDRAGYAAAVQKRKDHNIQYGIKLEQQLAKYKDADPMYAAIKEELTRISSDR